MSYKSRKRIGYGLSTPLPKLYPLAIKAQRDPTTADFQEISTVWINELTNDVWMITSVAAGVANWEPIGMDTGGSAPISKYIVDPDGTGDYTTIQAAINAANAAGIDATVYVRPGTYTENLTLYDGIDVVGATSISQNAGASITIIGQHTPPTSGHIGFNTICFINTSHVFNSAAAGTTHIGIFNCESGVQTGYFMNLPNWTGILEIYDFNPNTSGAPFAVDDGGINNQTGTSDIIGFNAGIGYNGTNPMYANGQLFLESGEIGTQLIMGTGANSIMQWMTFSDNVTWNGNSTGYIYFSSIISGATVAITMSSTADVEISNCVISTSNNPSIDGAGAGNLILSGVDFIDGSNLAATLTLIHTAETRSTKLLCGDGTYRVDEFSGNGNVIQAYCTDATATGANYNKAVRGDMTVSSGDGTDSPQAVRGNLVHLTGSHHEEGYGGYFWAQQDDGSQIDSNLIGLVAAAYPLETDVADLPQQWTYGLQGILFGDDAAAVPAAGIQAGIASYVTYNIPFNSLAHGFVASRNGGGAGGPAGSAYKVEAGSAIISDWDYGLDLYNGATGLTYAVSDIRLWNQTTIFSVNADDILTTLPDTGIWSFVSTDALETLLVTNDVDATIADEVEAARGSLSIQTGASVLQTTGVMGKCTQGDGSTITSTASGVEGWLNLLETDNADLPPVYAFAVKGYLDAADTTGIPGGLTAGVGSVVEYNTPFNSKAYGFVATRLDAGGGAGTAGYAAFGVAQGTVAAADWDYGIDFYGATSGFTYADIRFQNQSTCAVDTYGVSFSGDVSARSLNATNIKIDAFNQSPLVQTNVNTGGVPTGVAGDINLIHLQDGSIMEEFVITAQAILAPRMTATGLEIGGDQIATNGWEYNWGVDANRRFAFVSQTSSAFFIEATFTVTTVANVEYLWLGFRKNAANNANFALYTDGAMIGLHPATNPATAIIAQSLNGPGWAYTNTTDAFVNGSTHTLRVDVSAAGVITYQIDGGVPSAIPAVQTFDAGDIIIPWIGIKQAAAAFTTVQITQLAVGYSDWY